MKLRNVLSVFIIVFTFSPAAKTSDELSPSYDCTGEASTSANWENEKIKPKVDSEVKSTKDTVKLIDLDSKSPKLVGQSIGNLFKASETPSQIYFLEKTDAGNISMWVLFKKEKADKHVLISLKAYDLFGIASFTQVYSCRAHRLH